MNTPTPREIVDLVRKIRVATQERRLLWGTTSQETVFQAAIAENFVQISQMWDDESEGYYHVISIRNKSGRLLDEISAGTFYSALKSLEVVLAYPSDMEEIYKAARWQALGVGDVYKSLIENL